MRKLAPVLRIAFIFLLLSTAAHAVYLMEWSENRFMIGPNDGLSQMLPFKKLLYEQYTSGEFFYSPFFGLGSGTYSWLSYYFSTSIVFIITVGFFFILELLGIIGQPDILFFAHAAVFINIARLAAVLLITFLVFRYMKFKPVPAFLGASVYGLSSMYFRHAVYWEFFAGAYLWLPLLIFGAEKIFREKRAGWFLFAVALSMIDNFYFAYINFLLTGIYIVFRLFLPLEHNEIKRSSAAILFVISGVIGAGFSAVSFIPSVFAFLNNHRPAYMHEIEWWDLHDNILFTSSFVIVPAAFAVLVFAFPLFRDRKFRFFTSLVLFCILLHYSPQVASVFNGFSAPQYRWEYFISFTAGGAVAAGFSKLSWLTMKHFMAAGSFALFVYGLFALADSRLEIQPALLFSAIAISLLIFVLFALALKKNSKKGQAAVFVVIFLVILVAGYQFAIAVADNNITIQFPLFLGVLGSALFTFILFARTVHDQSKKGMAIAFIIVTLLSLANGFQYVLLVKSGNTQQVSEEYIKGEDYDDPAIRGLLAEIDKRQPDSFHRIGWMEGERNNTPIAQDFHGLSAYSSILNEEILHFYLYELEIDMARESVSRYATLGKRANLHSLLLGNFIILPLGDESIPANFEQIITSENYVVYENQLPLPFVRSATAVYSEETLAGQPVLMREHAMLEGVVLKNPAAEATLPSAPKELAFDVDVEEASFADGMLEVTGESGGIDLLLNDSIPAESDLYITFNLVNLTPDQGFSLSVNSYETSRKSNISVYKTFVDDLTIRIPADDTVRIRVPEGNYELTELAVYEEPYDVLRAEASQEAGDHKFEWDGSRIVAEYSNDGNDDYIVFPVPYEIGWTARVNGEKEKVLEANYAFLAVPASPGMNEIKLTYRPPHFGKSLLITVISLLAGIVYLRRWFR